DLLPVAKMGDAGGLERAHMDEDVFRRTVRRDEAEAFGGIEEFYSASLAHYRDPFPVSEEGTVTVTIPGRSVDFRFGERRKSVLSDGRKCGPRGGFCPRSFPVSG